MRAILSRPQCVNVSMCAVFQDLAAERCSMPYRAPELFNVDTYGTIDERVDIWVSLHFSFFFFFFLGGGGEEYIDGLMRERCNSSAFSMELHFLH